MKRAGLWALWVLLALGLGACGGRASPQEPDPRDIDPEDVSYIISGAVVIEDRAIIETLTGILNTLDPEHGVYDEDVWYNDSRHDAIPAGSGYSGGLWWYGEDGRLLARVAFFGDKVYRDHYLFNVLGEEIFDREALDHLAETLPEGVSPVTSLYFELMWGADRLWVEDLETGCTAVVSKSELLDELTDYFVELEFRVEEECPPEAEPRFQVRWTYMETDDLLEEVGVGADGRVQRHGHWCSVLGGSMDTALLEALASPDGGYADREEVAVFAEEASRSGTG